MLHRPQGGGGSSRYADLRVDVLDVVVGGLWRDVKAVGDLGRGETPRGEPQHLDLTTGEPAGVRAFSKFPGRLFTVTGSHEHSVGGAVLEHPL